MALNGLNVASWDVLHNDAAFIVARNSLVTGVLGGVAGSVAGVLRTPHVEPAIVAIRMARRWFVFSFGFFALREFVMRSATRNVWPMCTHPGHFQDVPSTFFSGALMGVITAGITRRPLVPGMLTISGLCTTAQLICNEFSLGFSHLLSKHYKDAAANTEARGLPITNAERRDALDSPQEPVAKSPSWFQSSYDWVLRHSPIQPISDDEYRQRLLTRKKEIEAELSAIEAELLQKRRALQAMDD